MSRYQLAQLNVGIIKAPLESPVMADFMGNLDRINALAESSPGFVWRLQTDEGNATALRPTDDANLLVNLSVWEDAESLSRFVFKSSHVEIMRRRREWFERMAEAPRAVVGPGGSPPDRRGSAHAACAPPRERPGAGSIHVPHRLSAARRRACRNAVRIRQRVSRVPAMNIKHLHAAILVLAFSVTLPAQGQVPVQPNPGPGRMLASADPKAAANKRLVYDFWREVFEGGHMELADKYMAESYIQHNPERADRASPRSSPSSRDVPSPNPSSLG